MNSYTFETYYAKKKDYALSQQRARQQEALDAIPELAMYIEQYAKLQQAFALASLQKNIVDMEQYRLNIETQIAERKALLKKYNFAENYIDIQYECELCHDSGHDQSGNICLCYKQRKTVRQPIPSTLDEEKCFECSDLTIFPEENEQRNMMSKLQDQCYQFAQAYPDTQKLNLFLVGPCGSGKSFLLSCIGNYIQQTKNIDVIYITSVSFKDIILNRVLAKRDEMELKQLYTTPFLIFDDLGSEPSVNDIIPQYFYELIEYRREKKLPWAMATNLTLRMLQERYGERSFSRLFDKQSSLVWQMPINGKDVRLFGKLSS